MKMPLHNLSFVINMRGFILIFWNDQMQLIPVILSGIYTRVYIPERAWRYSICLDKSVMSIQVRELAESRPK